MGNSQLNKSDYRNPRNSSAVLTRKVSTAGKKN